MEVEELIVLPAPDPKWDRKRLGGWVSDMASGASGLLAGAWPFRKKGEASDRELQDALLWLAHDLGTLGIFAGDLIAERETGLICEPIGDETNRLQQMALILGAFCSSDSEQIDMVRDGIAERLSAGVAELVARLEAVSTPAEARE